MTKPATRAQHRAREATGWGVTLAVLALMGWGVWSAHGESDRACSRVSHLDQRTHVLR